MRVSGPDWLDFGRAHPKACVINVRNRNYAALTMNNSPSTASESRVKPSSDGGSETADAENGPSDDALVVRCQAGDTGAFDELVTRYRGRVYAMIYNMVKSEADAWDLSQEAFIKAWKALPKFEARSSFYTWLYRIAHNVTYDWMRKRKVQAEGEFDETIQQSIDPKAKTVPFKEARPDDKIQHRELRSSIEAAIAKLSPEHRAVILLKEIDGRQYNEIAEIIGVSIGTVMSRLFYARKKLQSLLKDVYEAQ